MVPKCRWSELAHLTEREKSLLYELNSTILSKIPGGYTVYLIGSKSRGDFHDGSDIDLLVLYHSNNPGDYEMVQITLEVESYSIRTGITWSVMLFSREDVIYNCDEIPGYMWLEEARLREGIRILFD